MSVSKLDDRLDSDDPALADYRRFAKEIGLGQNAFSDWVSRTAKRLSGQEAALAERLKELVRREAAVEERERMLAAQRADYERLMTGLRARLGDLAHE
jgi:hypothetical protein